MNIPEWVQDLSVLLSPFFALAGVWLANLLSWKREQEAHQRLLERDQETHRRQLERDEEARRAVHAQLMFEKKQSLYPDIMKVARDLNAGDSATNDTNMRHYQEAIIYASPPVRDLMFQFNEKMKELRDSRGSEAEKEIQKEGSRLGAQLVTAMAADIQSGPQSNSAPTRDE